MIDRQSALEIFANRLRDDKYFGSVNGFPAYAAISLAVDGVEYGVAMPISDPQYIGKVCDRLYNWAEDQLPELYPNVDFSKSPSIIIIEHFRSPRS